jgi:hypothetical protein
MILAINVVHLRIRLDILIGVHANSTINFIHQVVVQDINLQL